MNPLSPCNSLGRAGEICQGQAAGDPPSTAGHHRTVTTAAATNDSWRIVWKTRVLETIGGKYRNTAGLAGNQDFKVCLLPSNACWFPFDGKGKRFD